MQLYKTVYFPDLADRNVGRRGLTIAFGPDDLDLYRQVEHLSSVRLRGLIGHETFAGLEREVKRSSSTLNAFCRAALRRGIERGLLRVNGQFVDYLQATFAGGRDDPLHDWFPYLEGYSPDFVWEIVSHYTPDATSVLDPFAGAGTTPITMMSMGRTGLYAEVNPVCLLLIETKALARTLSPNDRENLATLLFQLADSLERRLRSACPDGSLRSAYWAAFGSSRFFDQEQFDAVLKARSIIDDIQNTSAAKFATIAALRSLIPASLLIRRGDLRFKNDHELRRGQTAFGAEFRQSLRLIASDLREVHPARGKAIMVGNDALEANYEATFDAIITSPPYLNGTNYFRNTKIELWFMRALRSREELNAYRHKAVTAGINDVTKKKAAARGMAFRLAMLDDVVSAIQRTAYDPRIPLMVQTYFSDLWLSLSRAIPRLKDGGVVAIDIGDSAYGGVHVPTDQVLIEMGRQLGLQLKDDVTLRERLSRGGHKLRQALLVFEKTRDIRAVRPWSAAWERFKKTLPHQFGGMAARNWGNPLHSLCSYQGKLKPSIASSLVSSFVPEHGRVLDPFCGVGTIPFEAALRGANAFGFEISPSAYFIADAKIRKPREQDVRSLLNDLSRFIDGYKPSNDEFKSAAEVAFNSSIPDYFHKETLREILAARKFFLRTRSKSAAYSLLHACMQHILHGNRPYALSRRSHPLTPYAPTGPAEYRNLMERLTAKVEKSLAVDRGPDFRPGRVWRLDCTQAWPDEVTDLDAIITSPPFFDSTRFYLANWMRLWFSGWERAEFRTLPQHYVDELQKRSFDVYLPILQQARDRLKPSGVLVFHLGQSKKCDMGAELAKIASRYFTIADLFSENVEHCERHGIRDKGTVTAHQYLVLTS